MSEAELHLIRHRLTAGLRHKAAKGELRQGLPVGFVHDAEDRIVLDPDESVREPSPRSSASSRKPARSAR